MIAVCVTFVLKPGSMAAFRTSVLKQARLSLEQEPECHQFDVCIRHTAPDEVFLYELYSDRAAFAAHLESDHFKSFDGQTADLIADKSVNIHDVLAEGADTASP